MGGRAATGGVLKRLHRRLSEWLVRWRRRLLRWAFIGLGVIVLVPACWTLLYAVVPPPVTPLMLIRLVEGEGLSRNWARLDDISVNLREAVVAAEDNLFCTHRGFDVEALRQAWDEHRAGTRSRGASTITMQTAKNLWLWPAPSLLRKAIEAYLTFHLETLLPKRRILELYLNIAEWGPGIYGAEAAAKAHFGKSANQLSRREAALMAAVLPNPRRWSAGNPSNYIAGRAGVLERRVHQLGPLIDCVR